jgi:Ca-activated chloride channel homolog
MTRLIALLCATCCLAQQADDIIRINVSRVVLYATVREGKARFFDQLQQEDFTIFDNGLSQEILSFSRSDEPVAIGILVDNSASMLNKRSEVVAAAKAFVAASNPADEIFVLHFNETLHFGLPEGIEFSSNHVLLDQALDKMVLDGRTALYDAIGTGLDRLDKTRLNKKALIVISDGGDNVSATRYQQVVRKADLSGALFYGIGIYDIMDGDAKPDVLRKLARNTGGETYFPGSVAEVKILCETIARELRSQYSLSYAAPIPKASGEFRKVDVKVRNPKGVRLVVRARTGYYAGSATQ